MPPDLPNEQELVLKKRARRRLVGAIALVLLMIIILPRVLEDRAALAPQESIKITMPIEPNSQEVVALREDVVEAKLDSAQTSIPTAPQVPATIDTVPSEAPMGANNSAKQESDNDLSANKTGLATNSVENVKSVEKVQEKAVVKNEAVKAVEKKTSKVKVSEPKSEPVSKAVEEEVSKKSPASFTVQVGVYSDASNVKYLQSKIKEMGLNSHTEKVSTPKGEKIRLKAGSFSSRPDAVKAQEKLQKIGLSGMVVGND